MNYKLNKYVLAFSATAVALPVFSQSKSFEGNGLSMGVGSFQLKDASDATSKKWNGLGNIEFTKFKALDDSWLVGFGVGLDLGTSKLKESASAGGETLFFSTPESLTPGTLLPNAEGAYFGYQTGAARSIARKGNFAISVLPAYAFTPNDMGYLRLSFNRTKFTVTGGGGGGNWLSAGQVEAAGGVPESWGGGGDGCTAAPGTDACTMTAGAQGGASGSKYLNGAGLGIGYRRNIQENLFFQAEYKYVVYEKNDLLGIKPKDQGFVLSLGYRF